MIIIKPRNSKRKLQHDPSPLHVISKKLRSKIPRRRRRQISPVLLVSPRFKAFRENCGFSVVSVDSSSSSGSDFAGGEVSCDSSRISAVKGRTNSRSEISSGVECVRRFEKRNENEVEVSETSCVDSSSGVRRNLILKFENEKENDEVSEVCTKSELTFAEISKSSNGNSNLNLNISSEITRNDVVSVNRASESEFSQISRNRNADENCVIAQSIMKNYSDNSGYDSDLACSEKLQFSYYDDDESEEYCSSQGTTFSDVHSEIFGEGSDYSPSQFIDSGSEFSQGSVGETPSHTYSLLLRYRDEFAKLGSPVKATSIVEEDFSLHNNVRLVSSIA